MTFAKKGTYGVPEFAGTEVNQHSCKLKGLSGTCIEFTDKYTRHDGRNTDNHRHDGRGSTKSSSTHVFMDEQGKKKSIYQTI